MTGLGLARGVADLAMVLPGGGAAFVEFKAPKGRISTDQTAFRERVEAMGAKYALCRSVDDVEAALRLWGVQTKGRLS